MFEKRCFLFAAILTLCCVSLQARRQYPTYSVPKCAQTCVPVTRCSAYFGGELIWTLMDGICKIFVNGCIRTTQDCSRQNSCLPPSVNTTMAICKQNCARGCDASPQGVICGDFPVVSPPGQTEIEHFQFSNQCELDKWSCANSRPYVSSNNAACPAASK